MNSSGTEARGALFPLIWLVAAILLLLLAMAAKNHLHVLPGPPEESESPFFDSDRAAERLARVLGDERPHPVDSEASDDVRARLIAEMRAVGLEPRMTDDFICNSSRQSRTVSCARVRNLVATIGPDQGRHLLLSAHYDSTFAGPGAADAGIGIATLLETAALLRGRSLARPVTFLFNEGEEMGLLGARAFLELDPVARRVDSLINLEARGVEGPAIMFETSRPNAAAVAAFADAVDRPIANSLTTDLYGLIPNSTDVALFADRNWTILNFAIIGNETRYHSAGDNLAALDRQSLQHMGDQTLALALRLGQLPVEPGFGEWLYADLLGLHLFTLPLLPGLVLLGALTIGMAMLAIRRRAIGRPLLATLLAPLGASGLAFAGQFLVGLLRSGDYWRAFPLVTVTATYAAAIAACLVALAFVARGSDLPRLRASYWLAFLLVGSTLSMIAPGAAIFFLLPPLLFALGVAARGFHSSAEVIGACAAILLLYLTIGPALGLFEELMSNGPHWILAPMGALILLPVLIELTPLIRRIPPLFVGSGAADLFLLGWIAAAVMPAYSEDRQQVFSLDQVQDVDSKESRWAVNNDGVKPTLPGDWSRGALPWSNRKRWLSPAPVADVLAPEIELVEQVPSGRGRRLAFRLRAHGAETLTLIAPKEAGLRAAGSGRFVEPFAASADGEGRYVLRCVGRACDGALFHLAIDSREEVEFLLVGSRPGLSSQATALLQSRPAPARPQHSPDSTIAFTRLRI